MHKPIKYVEKAFTYVAKGAWVVFDKLNSIHPKPSITPKWADKPLLKSYRRRSRRWAGRARPTRCARSACRRSASRLWTANCRYEILLNEKVGEIKAQIIERDGKNHDGQGLPEAWPL